MVFCFSLHLPIICVCLQEHEHVYFYNATVILYVDIGVQIKRESPASGSWNIQEEIRRVRSRATEEMLRTRPSAKLDWSSLASDYKSNLSSARSDYLKIHSEDKMRHAIKLIDKSMNWSADNTVTHNLSGTLF